MGKQEEHHFTQKTCDNWIEFTAIGFKQDKPQKIGLSQVTRISFKQQSCRYMMSYRNGALNNQIQWRPSHFHQQQVFSRGWRLSKTVDVGSFALDIAKGTIYKFQQVYPPKASPKKKRIVIGYWQNWICLTTPNNIFPMYSPNRICPIGKVTNHKTKQQDVRLPEVYPHLGSQ